MRHIAAAALLLVSLGLEAQGPRSGVPGQSAAARSGGIDAILGTATASGEDFLPADQAFRFAALAEGTDGVRLDWQIAEGYYLYRARIKVTTPSARAQLGATQLPAGQIKNDEYFGKQEVYHHELIATVPVARARDGSFDLPLQVTYQGCAEAGLCYPPITKMVTVTLPAATSLGAVPGSAAGATAHSPGPNDQTWFASLIRSGSLFVMLGSFYLAGLLLSFTPCVLPMVPILSGIIAGGGANLTTARAFALSATYVFGMALTYALAGIACAAAGRQVQAVFQQWWVITLFAGLFVALGLSMLGLFTLQMPVSVQTRIASVSNRQSAGSFGGVAIMGALSALIVTTCVAPALVGALVVISQTGAIARGGAALFAMGVGMGTPLLAVGASAGKLLPRAGPWMDLVKKIFGVMMLAVAAWMLARIVPDRVALVLWALPALLLAWLLWSETRSPSASGWTLRALGVLVGLYGVALAAGSALGGTDPLAPLPAFAAKTPALPFRTIKTLADLDREVALARSRGRSVLVDFSADWCTSCKEMERYTFSDPAVQAALAQTVLLRADVTRNDSDDQALLRRFGIFGPPTIAFYGTDGQERAQYRVVGYMKADAFAERTRAALHAPS
ncbi:MAG TPA: protein-disulfide reductase DsbD [Steroidobacteraceae bacterium]|jgi:thiol:disulfide interchange protein DsbD|nr:protein-disulfide reductase DsbD [Steroidobacteraceae bacterium]